MVTQQSAQTPFSVTFDPEVYCHRVTLPKPGSFTKLLNKCLLSSAAGARILNEKLRALDLRFQLSSALQTCIQQIKPNLVISAGTNECVDLLYAGPLGEIPIIQMFHVYPPVCFAKNKYQRVTLLRKTLVHIKACQVLLPSHKETLAPYTTAPVHVIGNAVAYPPDAPLPSNDLREKTITYIAYFSKDKNQTMLLDAFAKLKRAEDWTLKLYGAGSPDWEARLQRQAETLGIANRVQFCGVTNDTQTVLAQTSVCAYPSLVEGFGLSLVEAMWMGVPCVGFADAPGVNEIVDHDVTGLLAPECTADAFAEQLQTLIDNPHLRVELGRIASETVRENFSEAHIWALWDAFIRENCR